jgi:putative transposase
MYPPEDATRQLVAEYIEHYNTVRLHCFIGYIAPVDKLNGRDQELFKERDQKLEAAWEQRRIKRDRRLKKRQFRSIRIPINSDSCRAHFDRGNTAYGYSNA